MTRTIELQDNQMAIVITIDSVDECISTNVMAFHGKAGTLESIDVFPRNPFNMDGSMDDFDKTHGFSPTAHTKQRYERPIYYRNGNMASMEGAIKQASKHISMIWSAMIRNNISQTPTSTHHPNPTTKPNPNPNPKLNPIQE